MTPKADQISRVVFKEFEKLPSKRKPCVRDNGLHEWVPLSAIVSEQDGGFQCLVLATGMKCLPASRLNGSNGIVLHDWHAEILSIRTFNRYLLDECSRLLNGGISEVVERGDNPSETSDTAAPERPFKVKDDIKLHMYCSEAPCGDASMELTMASQDDSTPWEIPAPAALERGDATLPGREFFSKLGIVRRKPGRRDAPPTLSKSCSDKLSLKQSTSLLSSLLSLLIEPQNAYIDTLILPESQYSQTGCERAFSRHGRMKNLDGRHWSEGFSFKPFNIETTEVEFRFSRKSVSQLSSKISPSSLSAAWSCSGFEESIIGGVIQGRKSTDPRGASKMSRRQMWLAVNALADQLERHSSVHQILPSRTYGDVKSKEYLAGRRKVKLDTRTEALSGWVSHEADRGFQLDLES